MLVLGTRGAALEPEAAAKRAVPTEFGSLAATILGALATARGRPRSWAPMPIGGGARELDADT